MPHPLSKISAEEYYSAQAMIEEADELRLQQYEAQVNDAIARAGMTREQLMHAELIRLAQYCEMGLIAGIDHMQAAADEGMKEIIQNRTAAESSEYDTDLPF